MKRVQAYPIQISLVITGPPGWDSSRGWMVGEAKGPAMDEVLRDAARLVHEAVPRLLKGWSHTDALAADHPVRVHVEVKGPTSSSVQIFGVGRGTTAGVKEIREAVQKAIRFVRDTTAQMELAWDDALRYQRWMREQEEARHKEKRGGPPRGKSS